MRPKFQKLSALKLAGRIMLQIAFVNVHLSENISNKYANKSVNRGS